MLLVKKYIILLLIALLAVPVGIANAARDDDDKDPGIKPGIRRLHPGRERAKAIKRLQEEMSRKAEPKDDPWDTGDEVWGTVDLPVTARDSAAVKGHRLTSPLEDGGTGKRMTWCDEPVTATIEQLMAYHTVDAEGDCRSKYVSLDSVSNEVYFAFTLTEDSVPGPLRLCVRYSAPSLLEFDQITFNVDGHDYIFFPAEPQHGRLAGGMCWEASDDVLRPAYRDLVYALAHGHWIIMKLTGNHGISQAKMLTDGQRDDFAHTLALYRLLGGTI